MDNNRLKRSRNTEDSKSTDTSTGDKNSHDDLPERPFKKPHIQVTIPPPPSSTSVSDPLQDIPKNHSPTEESTKAKSLSIDDEDTHSQASNNEDDVLLAKTNSTDNLQKAKIELSPLHKNRGKIMTSSELHPQHHKEYIELNSANEPSTNKNQEQSLPSLSVNDLSSHESVVSNGEIDYNNNEVNYQKDIQDYWINPIPTNVKGHDNTVAIVMDANKHSKPLSTSISIHSNHSYNYQEDIQISESTQNDTDAHSNICVVSELYSQDTHDGITELEPVKYQVMAQRLTL